MGVRELIFRDIRETLDQYRLYRVEPNGIDDGLMSQHRVSAPGIGESEPDEDAETSHDPLLGCAQIPMGLAEEWACDASNLTWIVDRLETLGLAQRRTVPHDRRVKLVVLTAKGLKTKTALMEEFRPPAELLELDHVDLEDLQRVLEKLRFSASMRE
jgi:DNA-binding MarR family transcriptional regulator